MKLELHRLSLRNFMGIKEYEENFNGQDMNIYGRNATGKSTIFSAFTFLLFGKDSLDRKDFGIKTLDADGNVLHGLDHEVEAVLSLDGVILTLKKVYYEKWTKKTNSITKTLTGHTTDHYIDGVPMAAKDYQDKINSIINEDAFKLLTNVLQFNEVLHWKKRRELVLEVCGNPTDAQVIASSKNLTELGILLQGKTVDDYKKIIAASMTSINKDIEKLPIRINEVMRNKPDISALDFEKLKVSVTDWKSTNETLRDKISVIRAGGSVPAKEKEILDIDNELYKMESDNKREIEDASLGLQTNINKVNAEIGQLERSIRVEERNIKDTNIMIVRKEEQMASVKASFVAKRDEVAPVVELSSVCPACNQGLPIEMLTEAHEKHVALYNKLKSDRLAYLKAEGISLADSIATLQAEVKESTKKLEAFKTKLAEDQITKAQLQEDIDHALSDKVNVKDTADYINLTISKKNLKTEIQAIRENVQEEVTKVQMEIRENDKFIEMTEKELAKEKQVKDAEARILELKEEEKELAKKFEELEKALHLTEEFMKIKVSLLEGNINSKFEMARFKMFNILVNGALDECCEVTYCGVPYADLNHAAKINIGLDIIKTLSRHYNFMAPIFIDNSESLNQALPMETQMIKLIVSDDPVLRTERSDS